jgi:Recombination endonuclease VII
MLCGCGCGEETVGVYKVSKKSKGWKKGEPLKFIQGHTSRHGKHTTLMTDRLCEKGHSKKAGEAHCKICSAATSRKWTRENPEKRRAIKLKCQYNTTPEAVQDKLVEQNNACDICKLPFSADNLPCMDHDHACCPGKDSCGKCLRSFLCSTCNFAIGALRDNVKLLGAAIQYLKKWETQKCQATQNLFSELRATAHIRMGLENPSSPELRCSAMAATA